MNKKLCLVASILAGVFCFFYVQMFSLEQTEFKVYVTQVGLYSEKENALAMQKDVEAFKETSYCYIKDGINVVVGDIYTDDKKANEAGVKLSENGFTCVIKEYDISKESYEQCKQGKVDNVLKELEN